MEQTVQTGGCLCGGVTFELHGELRPLVGCHCTQCQKTSGNYVLATSVSDDRLTLTRSDTLRWYTSSPNTVRGYDSAKRAFCHCCGANLFYKPHPSERTSIFVGTLDASPIRDALQTSCHIYVGTKHPFTELPSHLPSYPEDLPRS